MDSGNDKVKTVKVKAVNSSMFPMPEYATQSSAGCDLRANISEPFLMKAGAVELIPTGLYIELPEGYEAQIRSRSGLTLKHGIIVANGIGTVDADYRGEICVILANISKTDYEVSVGERIAQMVINEVCRAEFELCEKLNETERSAGGLGHSGKL